jgi:hypothetical protein
MHKELPHHSDYYQDYLAREKSHMQLLRMLHRKRIPVIWKPKTKRVKLAFKDGKIVIQ